MPASFIYKPDTWKGPVILVPWEGPQTAVIIIAGKKRFYGNYFNSNEGRHQYIFPKDLYELRNLKVSYNGQTGIIPDGRTSYEGPSLSNWKARAKGSLPPKIDTSKIKNIGYGFYGLMHPDWPIDASLELLDSQKHPKLSVLWNTFGRNYAALEEFLKLKKPRTLELHLINEPGLRNNRLGRYEVLYGLTVESFERKLLFKDKALRAKLENYFDSVATFLEKYDDPKLHLLISPTLESNLTVRGARELFSIASSVFGRIRKAEYVWNPVGNGPGDRPTNFGLFETHGPEAPAAHVVNLDGCDIDFPERPSILPQFIPSSAIPAYLAKYREARANFLWFAECNGIGPGSFLDPRKRTNWPTKETFKLIEKSVRGK